VIDSCGVYGGGGAYPVKRRRRLQVKVGESMAPWSVGASKVMISCDPSLENRTLVRAGIGRVLEGAMILPHRRGDLVKWWLPVSSADGGWKHSSDGDDDDDDEHNEGDDDDDDAH
jgi:hypothetical protein